MPVKSSKPSEKSLSEIVVQMLSENVPEEEIITSLVQTGVSEDKARKVLEKAKQEFEKFLGKKLEVKVSEIINKKLEDKFDEMRKEFGLKTGFTVSDLKEYSDKKDEELKQELAALKTELGALRIEVEEKLKTKPKEISGKVLRKNVLGYALIIAGLLLSVFLLHYLVELGSVFSFRVFSFKLFFDFGVIVVLALVVYFLVVSGFRVLEFVKSEESNKNENTEEKTVTELVSEEDLV